MRHLAEYYSDPDVKARMLEFLGGDRLERTSAVYVTACDRSATPDYGARSPQELWACLDAEREVMRSLWDRRSLLFDIDIEYVNFEYPAEPYLDPERVLDLQRPLVQRLRERLLDFGIAPLHLLSGRGHHLVWQVSRDAAVFRRLAEIGVLSSALRDVYSQSRLSSGECVGRETGAASMAVGLVLEFLSHEVLGDLESQLAVPVHLTAVETTRGERGREIVSIDLSEYGDPLDTRIIRIPFSAYHKPQQRRGILGAVTDELPLMFSVPFVDMEESQALATMRDLARAARLARSVSTEIPTADEGTARLVDAYLDSPSAAFHRWFHEADHDPSSVWSETYDRTDLSALPPCTARILAEPNEALLKPARLRHVTRTLMAFGWHPRHIAGLVRSKYERDFGWGRHFIEYEAAMRADFYVRTFAGLVALGLDDLGDFECENVRTLGYCEEEHCDDSLAPARSSLLERRRCERLAGRPLHGLFLPDEHL